VPLGNMTECVGHLPSAKCTAIRGMKCICCRQKKIALKCN